MKAQTESTQGAMMSNGQQITPVIIKGGGGPDVAPYPVQIKPEESFKSDFNTNPWHISHSAAPTRIMSLLITDGDEKIGPVSTDADPTFITLHVLYDQGYLHFDEEPLLDPLGIGIRIDSSAAFEITERPPGSTDEWIESTANFSSQITRVVFKQGEHLIIDHECQSPDVTLKVEIDWQKNG